MFNIGIGEILFIAILALVFIGPERLPKIMRQLGKYTYQARSIIHELTNEYKEELRPFQELRGLADDLKPTTHLGNLLNLDQALDVDLNSDTQTSAQATKPSSPMAQLTQAQHTEDVADGTIAPPRTDTPASKGTTTPMAQIAQAMAAQQQIPLDQAATGENGSDDQVSDAGQSDSTDPAPASDVKQSETTMADSATED